MRLALAALVLSSATCSPKSQETPRRSERRPDVLLVTFDTTRADHLGPYGCSYAFTPTLDRLARQGVKFDRAFASAPITLPSHTTIMTGLYPFYHGVHDNSHFVVKPEIETLAETMSRAGYQTSATVAAFVLDSQFGLDQGFDHYDDRVESKALKTPFAVPERIAEHVTDAAIEWLKGIDRDRPFFMWVHYYDPHADYRPPMTFTKFQGQPYDMEIAYADSELGRLVDYIEGSSPTDRLPLIVVAGDHGEALGEYGEPTHAYFAYDSTLHVPLIFRLPSGECAGTGVETVVGVVDVMPTILDTIGLNVPPPDAIHGRSLKPLFDGRPASAELSDRAIAFESYEPHYAYGWAPIRGVRVGETKFFDVPKPELYVLSDNPRELPEYNLYDTKPELVAQMRERFRFLWEGMLTTPSFAAEPQAPDEDTLAKLRALGYAGAPLPRDLDEEVGSDLKDMLPVYRRLLEAMTLIGSGQAEAAVQRLLVLYEEQPNNDRVLSLLAFIGSTQPEVGDRVLPLLQARLAAGNVTPDLMPTLLLACAQMADCMGKTDAAIKYCDDAIVIRPDSAAAYWTMGQMYFLRGDVINSLAPLAKAVDLFGPNAFERRAIYGLALIAAGRYQEGLTQWRDVMLACSQEQMLWAPASLCSLDVTLAKIVLPSLEAARTKGAPDADMLAAISLVESDCLRLLGRYADALERLQVAGNRLADDDAQYLTAEAILLRSLGRLDEARTLLSGVCEQSPVNANAARTYAGILESMGEFDLAVEVLRRLYQANPTDPMIMNDLAWMMGRQGKDVRQAIVLAEQAIACSPGTAAIIDTLGWLYHLDGRDRQALPLLMRARSLLPNEGGVAYRLAVVMKAVGEVEAARQHFAAAIELAGASRPEWYGDAKSALGE